ncbi:DUF418 domain-containing protein [Lederbergia galactosidilytica]|uniref:Membrane protein n=1 Tax=Lederbergia galactosidilytica TaxID=217031 RepID=A0A177ZIP5_9BACI|nr:DUF418 domain-containing protein [Lederbergia galactosidilytica]KRG15208.1 membrane protein [Virgibacillus soli]MBP1913128.1 uncharacterized protein [Lederbergia galactosidilytica]OAK67826.1 membrane protein [Lederbergia galactosidilytica]
MENKKIRVQAIDGIRGFSLLGILLANLLIFQYGFWGKDEMAFFSLSSADSFMNSFLRIFVEESFMPIFTFLFGYSMIMLKDSLEAKGLKVKRYFVRRAIFLLVLGGLHATFLWEGDILTFYGMMSFFLLLFLKRKQTTILVWGILLSSLLVLILGASAIVGDEEVELISPQNLATYIEKTNDIYGTGTYQEITYHRNNEDPLGDEAYLFIVAVLFSPIFTAPMFLFGMYAAKRKLFFNPLREKKLYQYAAAILIPIGLALKTINHLFPESSWAELAITVGGPLLAVGYIFGMALLYCQNGSKELRKLFESVGKLSMTNYILQTVICTTIFYGYGLGQFTKMGIGFSILVGLAIFGLQMCISRYYLTHFRSGPLEKVNRIWTYFSWSGRPRKRKKKMKAA